MVLRASNYPHGYGITSFDDSSAKVLADRIEAEKELARARLESTPLPKDPANFKVKAGDYVWNFHREKVAAESQYFATMASWQFKEAKECFIDLSDDEPELLARMIIWCYCGKYSVGTRVRPIHKANTLVEICRAGWQKDAQSFQEPEYSGTDAYMHMKMFVIADYYIVPKLEKYCLRELERSLWENDKAFMSCLSALDEIELPEEKLDKIIDCLVQQARHNYFSERQKAKIARTGERYPALKSIQFPSMLDGGDWDGFFPRVKRYS